MAYRRPWTREKTGNGSAYIQKILLLYQQNITSVEIGKHFGKDHTTILYHLRRMGIPTGIKRPHRGRGRKIILPVKKTVEVKVVKTYKYAHLFEEEVNPGKNYAEYLKAGGKNKTEIKKILKEKAKAVHLDGDIISLPNYFSAE